MLGRMDGENVSGWKSGARYRQDGSLLYDCVDGMKVVCGRAFQLENTGNRQN